LSSWFGIDADQMIIKNLEYGANIRIKANTKELIDNVLMNQKKPFVLRNENQFKYIQSEQSQKIVKIYDKGKQNRLEYNLIRIENKYKRAEPFQKAGICSINDLKDIEKLQLLNFDLNKSWNDCLIYEPPIREHLEDKYKLMEWGNQKYWTDIQEHYRNKFSRVKKKFNSYKVKNTANYQNVIKDLLVKNWSKFVESSKQEI